MFEETFFGMPVNHSTIKPLKAKSASILEDIKREYIYILEDITDLLEQQNVDPYYVLKCSK